MGNMYDVISELCQKKGVSIGRMCADIGIGRGVMSDLKYGRTKKLSVLTSEKIADYFGVSINTLLGTEKATTFTGDGLDEEIMELLKSASPEKKEAIAEYVRFVLSKKE